MAKTKEYARTLRQKKANKVQIPISSSGTISTNVADYQAYTQQQIEDYVSKLPYEVVAVFNDKGKLIAIDTEGNDSSVKSTLSTLGVYKYAKENPNVSNSMTHFHNHPIDDSTLGIFSSQDLSFYVSYSKAFSAGIKGSPTRNVVRTSDGRRFELEYVGGATKKVDSFLRSYNRALDQGNTEARKQNFSYKNKTGKNLSERQYNKLVDDYVSNWLTKNSTSYGFKFKSTKK